MKAPKMHSGLISIRTTELNGFELFQVSSFPNIAFSKFTSDIAAISWSTSFPFDFLKQINPSLEANWKLKISTE